jgi:pimeloyl-ACP methyl ester carboxylesterase
LHDAVPHVEVGGFRIAYRCAGSGPPLLLLHGGFGLDSRTWQRQLDDLSNSFTVVAWDAPGCGDSSDPPSSFELGDYADCLAGLGSALGLGPCHVVGVSWGGALALSLCDRHPAAVRSLVLAGAYAGWAGSLPAEEVEQRFTQLQEQVGRPLEEWVPSYLPGMFSPGAPPELADEMLRLMLDVRPGSLLTMLGGMARADLREALPRVQVPTLVLHAEHDVRAPLPVATDLAAAIPGAQLVVIPGAGHVSSMEAPERFEREVRTFLAGVTP